MEVADVAYAVARHRPIDLRGIPREIQYHILGWVGWHHADADELRAVRRRFGRHHTLCLQSYRFAVARWCSSCGEHTETPCLICNLCFAGLAIGLIAWE